MCMLTQTKIFLRPKRGRPVCTVPLSESESELGFILRWRVLSFSVWVRLLPFHGPCSAVFLPLRPRGREGGRRMLGCAGERSLAFAELGLVDDRAA